MDGQLRHASNANVVSALNQENRECRQQIVQLSNEVIGLTKALEEVTKRAQKHGVELHTLQKQMRVSYAFGFFRSSLISTFRSGRMPRRGKFFLGLHLSVATGKKQRSKSKTIVR